MLLYTALIGYLWQEALEEDRNFATLIDMIGSMQTREDNEDFRNPIDLMFEDLEREKPDCFAVRQYKKIKLAAGVISYKRHLKDHLIDQMGAYFSTRRFFHGPSNGIPVSSCPV